MKRLYAPFLQQLWGVNGNAPILPEHLLAKYNDDKGSFNTAPYNSLPVGSGPFKVVAWNRGQDVRMVANPDFYLGNPKLNEVIYKILPDENTEADAAADARARHARDGDSAMKWPQYAALAADPENGLIAIAGRFLSRSRTSTSICAIRSSATATCASRWPTRPNRNEIIQQSHSRIGDTGRDRSAARALVGLYQRHHAPPVRSSQGRAMLDADGWKVGPDGIRVKNGQRLEITFSTQTESNFGRQCKPSCNASGATSACRPTSRTIPPASFSITPPTAFCKAATTTWRPFQWIGAADPDDSAIYSAENMAPHGQNAMFWDNPVATAAMNDALSTIDQARQKARLRDRPAAAHQRRSDHHHRLRSRPFVYNSDLKGFDPSPVISAFWDPWNYSI